MLPAHPGQLAMLLDSIVANDSKYAIRNSLVIKALAIADALRYRVGFRIDPAEPDWPVAFIELPTGQVSWHLPQHDRDWDGHTTEQKFARIRAFNELQHRSSEGVAP